MRQPFLILVAALALSAASGSALPNGASIERATARDGHFALASGAPARFWGVNLVSAFPAAGEADAWAAAIAEAGVNVVRHHHLLRPSRDWIIRAPVSSLALYADDSRAPDPEAWARFDALNAALRRRGIRLLLSLHFSRRYLPGDADILDPGTDDARAWAESIAELNARPWQQSIDVAKLLPVVDERARLLFFEFARAILTHRNPGTGLAYAEDPQVLAWETINESSTEYALICGNRLPAYMAGRLQRRWEEYAAEHGIDGEAGDISNLQESRRKRLRSRFLHELDENFFRETVALVHSLGCKAPITFSNLWRGDDELAFAAELGTHIEDHAYVDALVTRDTSAWMDNVLPRTRVAGLPFVLGEFNEAEGERAIAAQGFARTQLALSAAAYGAYHGLDGIVWFAWNHGDRRLGPDGRARDEGRVPAIGDLCADGMLLDHFPLLSAIYRRGLVRQAGTTVALKAPVPVNAVSYSELMRGHAPQPPPGALSAVSVAKRFAPAASVAGAPPAPEFPDAPGDGRFVSDTGELVRDVAQGQLVVAAPCAEAFSGFCTNAPRAALRHLDVGAFTDTARGAIDFATVLVVADDGDRHLATARRILVSRTGLDDARGESCDPPAVVLRGLLPGAWKMRVNRPVATARTLHELASLDAIPLSTDSSGALALPVPLWTQARLEHE